MGGEAVLPGTREGGSAWGRGRALGSLLSNRLPSCLPPGQPLLEHSAPPAQAATSRRETKGRNQRERERGREGRRDRGGTTETWQARRSKSGQPKEDGGGRKTDRKKARLEEEGRERGRRREERGGGRKTREKEAQTGVQADSGTWNTSCYSLECALSGRLIAGACLSVCLSVCSFLRGTQVGVGYVAPGT